MSHEWAKKAVEHKLYSMRDVQKAEKQARAEVLAAVSKHRLDMDEGLCACGWESKGETWAEHILSLHPAASDLKELLQKEREKTLLELDENCDMCGNPLGDAVCVSCVNQQLEAVVEECANRVKSFSLTQEADIAKHQGNLTRRDVAGIIGARFACSLVDEIRALKKLQPAAKDLEAYVKNLPLSEIARIKGITGVAKLGKTYDRPDFYATEDE